VRLEVDCFFAAGNFLNPAGFFEVALADVPAFAARFFPPALCSRAFRPPRAFDEVDFGDLAMYVPRNDPLRSYGPAGREQALFRALLFVS
jgi:hypothetical protein